MSTYDLVICGGTLVTSTGLQRVDVAIADERIVALAPEINERARAVIDAHGLHLFSWCC